MPKLYFFIKTWKVAPIAHSQHNTFINLIINV